MAPSRSQTIAYQGEPGAYGEMAPAVSRFEFSQANLAVAQELVTKYPPGRQASPARYRPPMNAKPLAGTP